MGRCHRKVIYQKCVLLSKFWKRLFVKRLLVKNFKKLLSILHRLPITYVEGFIFTKISTCLSYQLQLEAYYILFHPKLKIKFYTRWNSNWLKKYMPNCLCYLNVNLYLSFLFPNNNSASSKSELKFLPVSEMGKFYTVH